GFDPGGIGKGLAADMVAQELMDCGARGACVNLGGDLRVEGEGPDAGRWIVAVEHPRGGDPVVVAALAAGAIATSTILKRAWTVTARTIPTRSIPTTASRSRVVPGTAFSRNAAHSVIRKKTAP